MKFNFIPFPQPLGKKIGRVVPLLYRHLRRHRQGARSAGRNAISQIPNYKDIVAASGPEVFVHGDAPVFFKRETGEIFREAIGFHSGRPNQKRVRHFSSAF